MIVQRRVVVVCDVCGEACPDGGDGDGVEHGGDAARARAQRAGWIHTVAQGPAWDRLDIAQGTPVDVCSTCVKCTCGLSPHAPECPAGRPTPVLTPN